MANSEYTNEVFRLSNSFSPPMVAGALAGSQCTAQAGAADQSRRGVCGGPGLGGDPCRTWSCV